MSALRKPKTGNEQTSTQTKSTSDMTQVGNLESMVLDARKFELVEVINFVSGPEQGKVVALTGKTVVGRSRSCEVTLTDASCSRQHAVFERRSKKMFVEDLRSTNGVKVNGVRIIAPVELVDGDRVQLGDSTVVRFGFMPHAEASIQQDFYHRATRDGLTNAFNKKSFEEAFAREVAHLPA